MKTSFTAASAAMVLAVAGAANAGITVYNSQAAFNAATTSQGVDNFNDLALVLLPSPLNRSAGAYSYTAAATNGLYGAGSPPADGWISTNTATDAMTFNAFSGSIGAIGGFFFGSNIAGGFAAGDMMISATDADGTVSQSIISATTSSFLGFVSDGTITSLTVSAVQPSGGFLWPTANNLTLGQAIPAPGAAALLGLGGLAANRRRR